MVKLVVRKNITIREDQLEWIRKNHINLSRFVQAKIDEGMKEHATPKDS